MPVTFDEMADAIANAFRDDETYGLPASGPHKPVKQEVREALTLLAIGLDDGGFSEPPDWADDLAAVLAQLENLEAFANDNAALAALADVDVASPAEGEFLTWRDGSWRNGGDLLILGDHGSVITSPGILLARDMEDGETDSGHGFVEASYFRRGGSSAFAAFDAGTQMVGFSFDHFAGVQVRPSIQFGSADQVMTNLYGLYDSPTIDTGTVTNRYGVRIQAPTLSNGGSIDNHYGVFIEELEGDISSWSIYAPGNSPSKLGGILTLGTYGATSVDPGLALSRNLHDGLTGNAHGFVEASYFRRGGGVAFASFDAMTVMAGNAYDHSVGFQSRHNIQFANGAQVMTYLYGAYDKPAIDTGTITNRYGYYAAAPTLTNGASITNHYGMYVEDLGASAYAYYSAGATPSYLGGPLGLGKQVTLAEMTAPSAPAANGVHLYAEDNGSGKTRLMARFATGAAQQVAIEP